MVDENLFFELADTLAKTTVDVFKKMAKTDLSIGKASYKEDKEVRGDISSIIGLTGSRKADDSDQSEDAFIDFKAVFVLTWPLEAYIEASNLMLKENYNTYNYEISDVGGEICNVIMGNVKPDFENKGFTANLSIPSVIHGSHHRVHYPLGSTIITMPLTGPNGDIVLEFGYAENQNRKKV